MLFLCSLHLLPFGEDTLDMVPLFIICRKFTSLRAQKMKRAVQPIQSWVQCPVVVKCFINDTHDNKDNYQQKKKRAETLKIHPTWSQSGPSSHVDRPELMRSFVPSFRRIKYRCRLVPLCRARLINNRFGVGGLSFCCLRCCCRSLITHLKILGRSEIVFCFLRLSFTVCLV